MVTSKRTTGFPLITTTFPSEAASGQVREQRELLEATFNSTLVGIIKIDLEARFQIVNDRFCEIIGRSREELLDGMSWHVITHPDDQRDTRDCITNLVEGAEHCTIEGRYVRPDGSFVWVSNGVSALREESGALVGAVAIVTDITARRVAEDAVRLTEQRYRDLIEGLGVAVYTTDAAGRITLYNEAAAELWGRRPELGADEWCGSFRMLTPEGEHLPHDQCPMAICLKENRAVRGFEAIAERPDGTRVNFLPLPTPLRDETGNHIGAVNVLVDITDRTMAQAEADRQRELVGAITQNMSVGLLLFDSDSRIEFMNPAAEKITGYRFEDVRGEVSHETFHCRRPDGSPFPISECEIDRANKAMRSMTGHEDVFVRPDGSFYNVLCNVSPVVIKGARIGVVVDLRDATEEKRAEEAIKRSMEVKDEFLGLVSHELRTPIATVLGNALVLLRRGDALPAESRHDALTDIADQTEKLQRIIENLLLLTRIDAGQRLDLDPVSLGPLVSHATESFRRRGLVREFTVRNETAGGIVLGQSEVLALVLDNLISNADKYSPTNTPVEICIFDDNEYVSVRVRDQGIGLADDEEEQVFTPFYRSPRARSHAKGIGLGLAVCKRVVEAQGGKIRAERRPEGGCDFIFSLTRYTDEHD